MGRDKGLLGVNGKPWAKIALEKLRTLGIPVLVSVNQLQWPDYLQHFRSEELILDRDDLKIHGPLNGVISTHLSQPDHDLIVLACDMINLQPFVLKKLFNEYQRSSEAIAFKGDSVEPLCAIYSSPGLKKIKALHDSNLLKNFSMKNVLENLETIYLPIDEGWQPLFKSINRAEDLP